jgi:abelson tyrosine-protein kinase 1
LKLVQANELRRQKETHDPLESISRGSPGLPHAHLPLSPTALCSAPADPEDVRNTLQALRASQNVQDRARDMADLNQLMSTALAAKDDVAMIEVLQIARSEMPDAIKTLERALKRVVEDGQLDTEDGSTPVPPPHQEAVNGDSPSVDLCDIGASHGSADLLDRKFIESGINALRRLSKVTNISLDLPYWTITWFEIDFEARVGIGFFSDVYRGTWRNQTVAIKVLSETTPRKIFLREVGIWKPLSHPNVLKLFGASSASGDPPWFLVRKVSLS